MKNNSVNSIYHYKDLNCWHKAQIIAIILFVFTTLVCCESFVEVDVPNSQLTSASVFEDKNTATAAMTQVYANMRDAGIFTGKTSGLSHLFGNYTDELDFYGNPQDGTVPFYNNVVLPSSSNVQSLWNSSYNQIYGANAVLEGVTKSVKLSAEDRNQLLGEALFTRALIHFYLTNVFGSIPYVKTTDYHKNISITKESTEVIYSYCIADLQQSITLLPEDYLTEDRTRPNKFAARALLSRVYLYTQQWNEASNEASSLLNNTSLYLFESDLNSIFLKESTSTIWQFAPGAIVSNTLEARTFIFSLGPPPLSALSTTLVNAFPIGDQRKLKWISSVSNGSSTWYYPAKYKNKTAGTSTEYSIVLRLSEMYLIRAEARAHAGDLIGSKEDLNKIRNTAGLGNTTAITQAEILNAILNERQLEFFTEFGHRFFDLKRFNSLDSALSGTKNGWNTFENLLPIPKSELVLNPNLNPQNTGY